METIVQPTLLNDVNTFKYLVSTLKYYSWSENELLNRLTSVKTNYDMAK